VNNPNSAGARTAEHVIDVESLTHASPPRALYLSEVMTQRLQIMAETHRVAKSEVLERALKRYLANESGDPRVDLRVLQQGSNTRSFRRPERDLAIASELIATFVRYFLTIAPPLPEGEHAAARALGHLRFEQVIEDIARRLRTDRSLIARVAAILSETANHELAQPATGCLPCAIDDQHRPTSPEQR
jgi:predicted transcriptional regulator